MEIQITNRLSALGHPHRLAILRLLMRRFPDRLSAGDISRALELKASTLSNYLSHLMQVGLVTQERSGTSLLYAPDMDALRGTVGYLFNDCCRGRPDLCPPIAPAARPGAAPMSQDPFRVLFICTGNSARSIFAETLLRGLGGGRFDVHSAGTRPRSELNPFAVKVLEDKGHDVTGLRSKTVAEYQGPEAVPFDFVFTVCDRAANEESAPWPSRGSTAHSGTAFWPSTRCRSTRSTPCRCSARSMTSARWATRCAHDRLCPQRTRPDREARAEAAARTRGADRVDQRRRGRRRDARASAGVRYGARPLGCRFRP